MASAKLTNRERLAQGLPVVELAGSPEAQARYRRRVSELADELAESPDELANSLHDSLYFEAKMAADAQKVIACVPPGPLREELLDMTPYEVLRHPARVLYRSLGAPCGALTPCSGVRLLVHAARPREHRGRRCRSSSSSRGQPAVDPEPARGRPPVLGGDASWSPALPPARDRVLLGLIDELAADVGRLRRRLKPESAIAFLAGRIAGHVEAIDVVVHPTAAELAREGLLVCGHEELAVEEGLAVVDARQRELRRLLGEPKP